MRNSNGVVLLAAAASCPNFPAAVGILPGVFIYLQAPFMPLHMCLHHSQRMHDMHRALTQIIMSCFHIDHWVRRQLLLPKASIIY